MYNVLGMTIKCPFTHYIKGQFMNEQDFISAVGKDSIDRMHYGEMLNELKKIFMGLGRTAMWLIEASNNWDEVEPNKEFFKEIGCRIYELASMTRADMDKFLNLIQSNAEYLYGEEFPEESWHIEGCECGEDHGEEE